MKSQIKYPKVTNPKAGDRVTIFTDPIFKRSVEGDAILKVKQGPHAPDVAIDDKRHLETWLVGFPDGTITYRNILVENGGD